MRPLIRALLIDVSGTLIVGNTPTPGAVEALGRLRQAGVPFKLCSNTSKESTASLLRRLNSQGFDIRSSAEGGDSSKELWTSIGAVKHVLHRFHCSRPFPLLTQSAREELSDHAGDNAEVFDAVVVGLAPSILTYDNLNTAFRILVGEGLVESGKKGQSVSQRIPLIAANKARYIQSDTNDRLSLGPGAFVTLLEYSAGVEAHVVGKPSRSFFETVINDFGEELMMNAKEGVIAVIGDDVENDLGEGALELGLWRVLVRTGKYRRGDEVKPDVVPPDELSDSFSSFVHSLLECGGVGQ